MRLKHNKRLLNALNANQLSAKWKVPAEDAGEVVAKTMRMPWPEIHATEVEEKKKKLRKMGWRRGCCRCHLGASVTRKTVPSPIPSVFSPFPRTMMASCYSMRLLFQATFLLLLFRIPQHYNFVKIFSYFIGTIFQCGLKLH